MGNRTFLSVNTAASSVGQYEEVAFETNNFVAPLWFCMVSEEQYQQYREQLWTAWEAYKPFLDEEELDGLSAGEAFYASLNLHIPWQEAVRQMRASLPVALTRYPALGPFVSEWIDALLTHIDGKQSPVIHLELAQFFDFYEEPFYYLAVIEENLSLWWDPDLAWFERNAEQWNAYRLGGEALPVREAAVGEFGINQEERNNSIGNAQEKKIIQSVEQPSPVPKQRVRWVQELYIWLLSILLAALCLAIWVWTANMWLALLAFLLPVICVVMWEVLKRPKAMPVRGSARKKSLPGEREIICYGGYLPITAKGFEAVAPAGDESFTVPWKHIEHLQSSESNAIGLVVRQGYEQRYPAGSSAAIDPKLSPEDVIAAANTMVRLSRL
ncbi:hypothetical protein EBB07_10845 [Paenibacillaceae bacterium]|nr:hypothetical protein EBB07_10845 [Paenibacillaceae bacterium]